MLVHILNVVGNAKRILSIAFINVVGGSKLIARGVGDRLLLRRIGDISNHTRSKWLTGNIGSASRVPLFNNELLVLVIGLTIRDVNIVSGSAFLRKDVLTRFDVFIVGVSVGEILSLQVRK